MPVRVYYEDTDFSGVVYHASYLRFMERGRTNYLRLLGADQRALFEEAEQRGAGLLFVVRAMQIEFLKPARMDDVLEVVTAPGGEGRLDGAASARDARGEEVLIEAHVQVAFVSGGRARPIPKPLRSGCGPMTRPAATDRAVRNVPCPRRAAHVKALHMSWKQRARRAAITTAI